MQPNAMSPSPLKLFRANSVSQSVKNMSNHIDAQWTQPSDDHDGTYNSQNQKQQLAVSTKFATLAGTMPMHLNDLKRSTQIEEQKVPQSFMVVAQKDGDPDEDDNDLSA